MSLRRFADRHRVLAVEQDRLLQEIRRLPGFEKFPLHKPFSRLRAAAHSGPVVVLNAAKARCDALIVVAGVDHVIHVPLLDLTSERCGNPQVTLGDLVRDTGAGGCKGQTASQCAYRGPGQWDHILPQLWESIVKPVLDALAFSVAPKELSRIFWCPTGPLAFLPIHAAGLYDRQYSEFGHKVFDFVVSSYVPNVATLLPSPSTAAVPSGDLRLLTVRQPASDGQVPLSGLITEVEYIREAIENSPLAQTTLMESSVGTVEEVLSLMKETNWVHFACHGIQDGLDSGLCLADGRRLKLRDMIVLAHPRGGLAFLSACRTAMRKNLYGEAIHLAAGMLSAGYRGVISTMWSTSDEPTHRVVRDVYGQLFKKGTRPDYREAARALHDAIAGLRDIGAPFDEWVPFIHMGL